MRASVVIIALNAEKTIARCLSSLVNQTLKPHEIIVVNGSSTDKTREIAQQFPVKLLVAPTKHTYGLSRNMGVKAAETEIVAFIDSDDYAERDWLENITRGFINKDVGMIGITREYFYPMNWFTEFKWDLLGGRRARRQRLQTSKVKSEGFHLIPITTFGKYLGTSGTAYRKEAIDHVGYFDEDMFFACEDVDLAIRIIRAGYKAMYAPNAVIHFKPATSVREWIRETFWRLGVGYGTIRRKHGVKKPPMLTPLATVLVVSCMIAGFLSGILFITILGALGLVVGLGWRTASYALRTKRPLQSLVYASIESINRNLQLIGFLIGFFIPARTLKKIVRR